MKRHCHYRHVLNIFVEQRAVNRVENLVFSAGSRASRKMPHRSLCACPFSLVPNE